MVSRRTCSHRRTCPARRVRPPALRTAFTVATTLATVSCTEVPRTYSTRAAVGERIFTDDFSGGLSDAWNATAPDGVKVDNGVLKLSGVKNHPLWLEQTLPDDVRIEFDAWATTDEGDIKVELAGDGKSVATTLNYVATGYVVIFGGWNNSLNAICRMREHGRDRETTSDPKVEPGRRYHFELTRMAGEIRWEIDGEEILVYEDLQPLRGEGHGHFAFSGWEAETHFDNLVIEAL